MKRKVFQVDAFTDKCFGGNPAGVILDSWDLGDEEMQKIARELNLSETAFVSMSHDSNDYIVKFFTPTQEVDLCGHATIATFFVIGTIFGLHKKGSRVITNQKTRAGTLPVELNYNNKVLESIMMTQTTPVFFQEIKDLTYLALVLGIDKESIGIEGFNILPQVVSTGLRDVILPVKNLRVLKKIKPDMKKLAQYSNNLGVTGVHAFTMETEDMNSNMACRNFSPAVGIDEEAATGTSNGALAAFLINKNIVPFNGKTRLICEQGYYMDRPSKIIVDVEGKTKDMKIKVGGKAVIVIEGTINF